jgi:cytochrome c biogenesis protein CcmG, thiol:disulfide interchange protein DsbE
VRRRLVWTAAAIVMAAALTACSSSHSSSKAGFGGVGSKSPTLLAAAHLAPCPASSATPVSGGLPNLTLPCLGNGPQVHLAGLTGKPTVVNVWGAWCGPCQSEAAFLSSTYDLVHAKVRFLGVDVEDTDNDALSFSAAVKPPVHYPSTVDPDKTVLDDLHFQGPPETLFLDRAGHVVHVHSGEYTSAAQVHADVKTYLHVAA